MSRGFRRRLIDMVKDAGLYAELRSARAGFPQEHRERLRELRRFRGSDAAAALRSVRGDGSGPKVLCVAASSPGLYRLRIEALMAKTLEARDATTVWVLDDRHEVWHAEHLRAFGFREFVHLDDYTPPRAELEQLADELLRDCRDLFDVLAVTHDGYGVGFSAASRALNRLRRGRLDPADPEVAAEFRWALANSLAAAIAAERIVADVRPEKHIATAQNLTPWAEFYEAALKHGVDTLYWMHAHVEESLLWRRYSYEDRHEHFFTLAPETWERVRDEQWSGADAAAFLGSLRDSYVTGNWFHRKRLQDKRVKSRDEIVAELGLDPAKKTAFVFSHVLYDATFWFGENLFADYIEWLLETAKAAAQNPNVNWVVKLHPENVRRWVETVGRYDLENLEEYRLLRELFPDGFPDHIRLLTPENDTSTLSLFDFADYAITVRGTVGLEFPCFGVPTLTAGTGGYSGRGFTIDSASREEYLERLARIEEIPRLPPEQTALAQRFSHGVFHLKPVPFTSFEAHLLPDEEWTRGWMGHSFDFNLRTPDEVRDAPDLARFARWALQSADRDLLSPEADLRLRAAAAEPVAAVR